MNEEWSWTFFGILYSTTVYSMSKKNPPPCGFQTFFPKRLEIFNVFTYLLRVPVYARLQIYIQLSPTLTKLCHTKRRPPVDFFYISLELNFIVCLLSKWRRCWCYVISSMFVDIIKAADLEWLATDNDQQSYQRLSQTSKRLRFGRRWTFWAYYVN